MQRELDLLAEEFISYKGNKRYTHYPLALWDRAVQLSQNHSLTEIAGALKISKRALENHIHNKRQNKKISSSFIPVAISQQGAIQLHIEGVVPLKIDFDKSVEDLAKFVLALQGGSIC
jgi:hypothetical protein